MNIVFFQFGDYGEAYRNLKSGGQESFRDQSYTVDFVASLAKEHRMSTVAICDRPHNEELAPNLQSVGLTLSQAREPAKVRRLLTELAPSVIVLRTPRRTVLEWARKQRVPTLPLFADFMPRPRGPRSWLSSLRLRRVLGDDIFPAISNHSLNASLSLVQNLHLPAHRIVPWDRVLQTVDAAVKSAPVASGQIKAFYAGTLSEDKGVSDCLEAVRLLQTRNIGLSLRFAGAGDTGAWLSRAQKLGVDTQVAFLGIIANEAVRAEMHSSDMVIVPSRHSYAEGLPNTLTEGLASGTPVICSNHPAFANRLRHGTDVLMFQGASTTGLADAVQRLASEPELYARLSANAAQAHKGLFFGTEWADLIRLFVNDPQNRTGWVREHSLEALLAAKAHTQNGD